MPNCKTCRFWSDRIACSIGSRIYAYCLHVESPRYNRVNTAGEIYRGYTSERDGCDKHEGGNPIDEAA